MAKKLLATAALATILTTTGTASAGLGDIFTIVEKIKHELIDKPITQMTRVNVKVHNDSNRTVVAVLGGERVTLGPRSNHIFRNKGIADRVIVHFRDARTGQVIRSIDKGLPSGNISVSFKG
ncbi:hypothetical protein [Sedimenticola sp.]|uniref:hypothetical protein n=1 Tax=Sedimenticola sp. TaxID=1940285 RepID=UPI003D126A85